MKVGQLASFKRNSLARVVLPAPFGPAIMSILLRGSIVGIVADVRFRISHGRCGLQDTGDELGAAGPRSYRPAWKATRTGAEGGGGCVGGVGVGSTGVVRIDFTQIAAI